MAETVECVKWKHQENWNQRADQTMNELKEQVGRIRVQLGWIIGGATVVATLASTVLAKLLG